MKEQQHSRAARGIRSTAKKVAILAVILLAAAVAALAGVVAFGTVAPPPPLAAVHKAFDYIDFSDLPKLATYPTRDGSNLAYRRYGGSSDQTAVLIHGSAGQSAGMHALAKALRDAGFTVYALDVRGHGASGRRGDIDYIGQIDNDIADFAAFIRSQNSTARLTLLGASSGGGLVLRIAAGPYGNLFDRYVLLAPMLGPDAPTVRPGVGGWAVPFIPRIVGLTILNRLGIHRFDGLPVLAFAVPPDKQDRLVSTYSYRLMLNFGTNSNYLAHFRGAAKPMAVFVGSGDELFFADRFEPLVHSVRPDIPVTVLSGFGHADLVTKPAALSPIVAALGGGRP
jgi:non-heme chloroperoxidase